MSSGPGRAREHHAGSGLAIIGMLAVSALALAFSPLALDSSYSWVEHTTSEAGGQRVEGAWVARLGFLLFGLAVLWSAHRRSGTWRRPATALHVVFGSCMLGVAAFSLRSWTDGVPFDRAEDLLHSVAATVMGFAFALGVATACWWPGRRARFRLLDLVAIAASAAIPLAMTAFTAYAGALQRAMFAIAYVWYAREALADARRSADPAALISEAIRTGDA